MRSRRSARSASRHAAQAIGFEPGIPVIRTGKAAGSFPARRARRLTASNSARRAPDRAPRRPLGSPERARCQRRSSGSARAASRSSPASDRPPRASPTAATIEADIIVGADGIHSVVRESLFGAEAPRFTGCVCWRGMVPIDARAARAHYRATARCGMGPHGHVVHYPGAARRAREHRRALRQRCLDRGILDPRM